MTLDSLAFRHESDLEEKVNQTLKYIAWPLFGSLLKFGYLTPIGVFGYIFSEIVHVPQ